MWCGVPEQAQLRKYAHPRQNSSMHGGIVLGLKWFSKLCGSPSYRFVTAGKGAATLLQHLQKLSASMAQTQLAREFCLQQTPGTRYFITKLTFCCEHGSFDTLLMLYVSPPCPPVQSHTQGCVEVNYQAWLCNPPVQPTSGRWKPGFVCGVSLLTSRQCLWSFPGQCAATAGTGRGALTGSGVTGFPCMLESRFSTALLCSSVTFTACYCCPWD